MMLFVCTDHDTHWPVGAASVVLAASLEEARALLDKELVADGLKPHAQHAYTLRLVLLDTPGAALLCNGEY